ncbi:MAG: hypothetical protein ABIR03_14215 [Ginsengibacter sp.]
MNDTSFISRKKFISLASQLSNIYNPNPDDPEPVGPWGPVIRQAYQFSKLSWVALNPQPLPPKEVIAMNLARQVIDRAGLMNEIANGVNSNGEKQGIIIVSGYISRFIDDCGNGVIKIKIPKRRGPVPNPDPDPTLQPIDFIMMGLQFQAEANATGDEGLKKVFADAAGKLLDKGIGNKQKETL